MFKGRNILWWYLLAWILLNMVQAFYSELLHDESYYWFYSRDLDWGYFDHPPAIAVFIKLGYWIFPNELGVRFLVILCSTASLWMIYDMLPDKYIHRYFFFVGSILITHVGAFISVPDIPLVFFTTLFLYLYKHYLFRDHWGLALLLGMAVAGLAYSKYHGALVVFFAFIAHVKIARRPSFWLIPIVAALLFLPHIFWQIQHDFPTFRYQLFDRSKVPYKIEFFFTYVLGQFLIFGPLISWMVFVGALRNRAADKFERVLMVLTGGIFLFFLLQSFRGRIEPNWTVMAFPSLIYLSFRFWAGRPSFRKLLLWFGIPNLLLILAFRIFLMVDFLPAGTNPRNEMHGWDRWAQDIGELAGDHPVVFLNSFQMPSKYMFYSGKWAHSYNDVAYAGKQYDLLTHAEEKLQGKQVLMVTGPTPRRDTMVVGPGWNFGYEWISDFRSYNRIKIDLDQQTYRLPPDTTINITLTISNPTDKEVDFKANPAFPVRLSYCQFWYGKRQHCVDDETVLPFERLAPGESKQMTFPVTSPSEPGKYYRFRFGLRTGTFVGRNSNFRKLIIEPI